ncbi:hypothetical protein [Paramuribaculum intestinale]|uniref:hypothetical protein n=1 Tax=Paramuribaculum intestinale TaxID=2094151 RepID=UPI0025B79A91|nr:hypothetical protein [Paramuribaculum intestinale]
MFFADQAAREAAFKRGCYGIDKIPWFTSASSMVRWMYGESGVYPDNLYGVNKNSTWIWRKPTKYRLGDFNKYNHLAQPLSRGYNESNVEVPLYSSTYMLALLNGDSTGIMLKDICESGVWWGGGEAGDPDSLCLGLCISANSSTKIAMLFSDMKPQYMTYEAQFQIVSSQFFSIFKDKDFPVDCKTFIFLAALTGSKPTGIVTPGSLSGLFCPIVCSEQTIRFSKEGLKILVTVVGELRTETATKVCCRLRLVNESRNDYYIQPTLYLVNGDGAPYNVLDSHSWSRQLLAPGDTFLQTDIMLDRGSVEGYKLYTRAEVRIYTVATGGVHVAMLDSDTQQVYQGTLPPWT